MLLSVNERSLVIILISLFSKIEKGKSTIPKSNLLLYPNHGTASVVKGMEIYKS